MLKYLNTLMARNRCVRSTREVLVWSLHSRTNQLRNTVVHLGEFAVVDTNS